MNFKRFHESKNLLNPVPYKEGYYINENGIEVAATGLFNIWSHSVSQNQTYTISVNESLSGSMVRAHAYNNGIWLELMNSTGVQNLPMTFTTPANCNEIRISATSSATGHLMLNTGSEALPYEPYSSEVWHDIPHYIHNTSTDTITTPADIYANDTTATVGLKGQMEQSGTPSPTTPIQPSECGERTGNLFDYKSVYSSYINANGDIATTANNITSWNSIPQEWVGKTITISCYIKSIDASFVIVQGQVDNSYITGNAIYSGQTGYTEITITPVSTSDRWRISYGSGTVNVVINQVMAEESSTRTAYQPYGYKIPILSGGTTTNVYMGEVQSTRKIYKMAFDGTENITSVSIGTGLAFLYIPEKTPNKWSTADNIVSSHFKSEYANNDGNIYFTANRMVMINLSCATVEEFKQYLADQYAAGTPVCVWYVLATPETAVVNEPLRKIGDYADTVSGITIPTIAGANTISVDTTLQPSEVTVNYKGWHPVQSVHEAVQSNNLFNPEHHITIENVDYIGDIYPANKYRINNVSNSPCYYKIGESGTTGTVNPTTNIYLNANDVVYVWCSVNSNKKIGLTEGSTVKEYEPYGIIWNP